MKKILIVDDDKDIRDLLEEKLVKNKYTVMTSSTGKEALTVCKANLPDLILLDIAMPEMDGYTVARELKKEKVTKDIPIIFLTGKELEPRGINERIGEIGAYGFIMKPCSLKELLEKIRTAIG